MVVQTTASDLGDVLQGEQSKKAQLYITSKGREGGVNVIAQRSIGTKGGGVVRVYNVPRGGGAPQRVYIGPVEGPKPIEQKVVKPVTGLSERGKQLAQQIRDRTGPSLMDGLNLFDLRKAQVSARLAVEGEKLQTELDSISADRQAEAQALNNEIERYNQTGQGDPRALSERVSSFNRKVADDTKTITAKVGDFNAKVEAAQKMKTYEFKPTIPIGRTNVVRPEENMARSLDVKNLGVQPKQAPGLEPLAQLWKERAIPIDKPETIVGRNIQEQQVKTTMLFRRFGFNQTASYGVGRALGLQTGLALGGLETFSRLAGSGAYFVTGSQEAKGLFEFAAPFALTYKPAPTQTVKSVAFTGKGYFPDVLTFEKGIGEGTAFSGKALAEGVTTKVVEVRPLGLFPGPLKNIGMKTQTITTVESFSFQNVAVPASVEKPSFIAVVKDQPGVSAVSFRAKEVGFLNVTKVGGGYLEPALFQSTRFPTAFEGMYIGAPTQNIQTLGAKIIQPVYQRGFGPSSMEASAFGTAKSTASVKDIIEGVGKEQKTIGQQVKLYQKTGFVSTEKAGMLRMDVTMVAPEKPIIEQQFMGYRPITEGRQILYSPIYEEKTISYLGKFSSRETGTMLIGGKPVPYSIKFGGYFQGTTFESLLPKNYEGFAGRVAKDVAKEKFPILESELKQLGQNVQRSAGGTLMVQQTAQKTATNVAKAVTTPPTAISKSLSGTVAITKPVALTIPGSATALGLQAGSSALARTRIVPGLASGYDTRDFSLYAPAARTATVSVGVVQSPVVAKASVLATPQIFASPQIYKMELKTSSLIGQAVGMKVGNAVGQQFKTGQEFKTEFKTEFKQIQPEALKTQTLETTIFAPVQIFRPMPPTIITPTFRPPPPPGFPGGKKKPKIEEPMNFGQPSRAAFTVLGRRRGKTVVLGSGLPFGRATSLGVGFARTTLGRSFKIVQTGTTGMSDISARIPSDVFRPARSKALAGFQVQKSRYALSSPLERMEIKQARKRRFF